MASPATGVSLPAATLLLIAHPPTRAACSSAQLRSMASAALHAQLTQPRRAVCRLRPAGVAAKKALPRLVANKNSVAVTCSGVEGGVEALPAAEAVPRSVPVRVAYELQQAGHRYLDVRTEGEFSAGHPEGAVNIPYMYKNGSGMTKNTHFVEQVSRVFGKDDEIIVGCQSGKRSLMAATELCAAGFNSVTDIAGGFSSWRDNGLPVNQ